MSSISTSSESCSSSDASAMDSTSKTQKRKDHSPSPPPSSPVEKKSKVEVEPENNVALDDPKKKVLTLVIVNVKSNHNGGPIGKGRAYKNFAAWEAQPCNIYCGRHVQHVTKKGSPYRNPHSFPKDDESERKSVISKYEEYQLKKNKVHLALLVDLLERARNHPAISTFYLGCWCAPKECHVEQLIAYVLDASSKSECEFFLRA